MECVTECRYQISEACANHQFYLQFCRVHDQRVRFVRILVIGRSLVVYKEIVVVHI